MSKDRKTYCAICGTPTDFLAHSPFLCLSCGDRMQSQPAFGRMVAIYISQLQEAVALYRAALVESKAKLKMCEEKRGHDMRNRQN